MSRIQKYALLAGALAAMLGIAHGVDRVELTHFENLQNFMVFVGLMGALFAAYFLLIYKKGYGLRLRDILIGAVLLRVAMLGITPNLSDDYYRFVWDGRLMVSGHNPYTVLPEAWVETDVITATDLEMTGEVYDGLNSKQYYTVYPPINQLFFTISVALGPDSIAASVFWMQVLLLLGEIGLFFVLIWLIRKFRLPNWSLMIYALNPLVIVETVGNLHYEGIMTLALLGSAALLVKGRWLPSAVVYALAVGVKLIPVIFLPLLYRKLKLGKLLLFYGIVFLFLALTFAPFITDELIENFGSSIDLYFRSFEFNASIYYVARKIGEWVTSYNMIKYIGPGLGIVTFVLIGCIGLLSKRTTYLDFLRHAFIALSIYLFFSTTIHPWYLITLIGLSTFVSFRYALVWSAMAVLSYYKYINTTYPEPYWLITLEYVVVFGVLLAEVFVLKRRGLPEIDKGY